MAIMSECYVKVRSNFTNDALKIYRAHFDIFDLNGDGEVSAIELKNVANQIGYRLTKQDIKVS